MAISDELGLLQKELMRKLLHLAVLVFKAYWDDVGPRVVGFPEGFLL